MTGAQWSELLRADEAAFLDAAIAAGLDTAVDLRGAKLAGRDLTGLDLLALDLEGADVTGATFTADQLLRARIVGVDLARAVIQGDASVRGAHLQRCLFKGAKLEGIDWSTAVLGEGNQGLPSPAVAG